MTTTSTDPAKRRSRMWSLTWNNPPANAKERCEQYHAQKVITYVIAGEEVGESGTPHLQMFMIVDYPMYYGTVKSFFPGVWAQETYAGATAEQNITYCKKGGTWWEVGTPPVDAPVRPTGGGDAQKEKWETIVAKAKAGDVESIDASYLLRYFTAIQKLSHHSYTSSDDLDHCCGIWIYGPINTGKSHVVREAFGPRNILLKTKTKWWDMYSGQPVVLLDEIDCQWAWENRALLKEWCDKYQFPGEVKGGVIQMRPKCIIVTSNWSIDEVYEGHRVIPNDIAAFKKRFIQVHMNERGAISPAELRELAETRELPERMKPGGHLFTGGKRQRDDADNDQL